MNKRTWLKVRLTVSVAVLLLVFAVAFYVYSAANAGVCYQSFCSGDTVSVTDPLVYPISSLPNSPLHPPDVVSINPKDANSTIVVYLTIASPVPITVGTGITLSAIGTASQTMLKNISEVDVTFPDAIPYKFAVGIAGSGYSFGNGYGVGLTPNMTRQSQPTRINLGEPMVGQGATISFSQAGTYTPLFTISFNNGTKSEQFPYTAFAISVLDPQILRSQSFNDITLALTWALVAFGFLEAVSVIVDLNKPNHD